MKDILADIVAYKRLEVQAAMKACSLEVCRKKALDAEPARPFFKAVAEPAGQLQVIAEVKKASPSAGLIRQDFDPVAIAQAYASHGAAAISCLTDEKFFQGSLAYIQAIKAQVPLPVLRKDFTIHPYQVYEARQAGADAILLIAECLPQEGLLVELLDRAVELGMTVLVEVHDRENLLKVWPAIQSRHPAHILLGINNRNLKTMTTDIQHTLELVDLVEDRRILVSESGIRTHGDIQRLAQAGVHRVLVGEHLMRQPKVGLALKSLMEG